MIKRILFSQRSMLVCLLAVIVIVFNIGARLADAASVKYSANEIILSPGFDPQYVELIPPTGVDLETFLNNPPQTGGPAVCPGYGYGYFGSVAGDGWCQIFLGGKGNDSSIAMLPPKVYDEDGNLITVNISTSTPRHFWFSVSNEARIVMEPNRDSKGYPRGLNISLVESSPTDQIPMKTFSIYPRINRYQFTYLSGGDLTTYSSEEMSPLPHFKISTKGFLRAIPNYFCEQNNVGSIDVEFTYNDRNLTPNQFFNMQTLFKYDTYSDLFSSSHHWWDYNAGKGKITLTLRSNAVGTENIEFRYYNSPSPSGGGIFAKTVVPFTLIGGSPCGTQLMTITGDSSITVNAGEDYSKLYSVPSSSKWYVSWLNTELPGVKISSPVPSPVFVGQGEPSCQEIPPPEELSMLPSSGNNFGFIHNFLNKIIKHAMAEIACWVYSPPEGTSQSLKIDAKDVPKSFSGTGTIQLRTISSTNGGVVGVKNVTVNVASIVPLVNRDILVAEGGSSESVTVTANRKFVKSGLTFSDDADLYGLISNISGSEDIRTFIVSAPAGTLDTGLLHETFPVTVTVSGYNDDNFDISSNTTFNVTVIKNLPDLTAGQITPISTTTGVATTYSSKIKNQGKATADGNFPVLFQWTNIDPNGSAVASSIFSKNIAYAQGPVCTPTASSPCILSLNPIPTLAISSGGERTVSSTPHTFSTPGNYWIRACADKSSASGGGIVTEIDEENNCSSPWTKVAVTTTVMPDLVAQAIPDTTTASAGVPVTLKSTIKNQGMATTGVGFNNLVQIRDTDPTGVIQTGFLFAKQVFADVDIFQSLPMGPLGPGISAEASYTYTFAQAGNYWVRFCADKSSPTDIGVIAESHEEESSNCGAWRMISVGNLPDLTAGAITPTSSSTGNTTFSSTIRNQGLGSTPDGLLFTNKFQLANYNPEANSQTNSGFWKTAHAQVGQQWIQNYTTANMSNVTGNGGTKITTKTISIATAGTYWMRACADLPPDPLGRIFEGSPASVRENNNCGGWTEITISNLPDLTATSVLPTETGVNAPTVFSAMVSNIGAGNTSEGFYNFFQVANYEPGIVPLPPGGEGGSSGADSGIIKRVFAQGSEQAEWVLDLSPSTMPALSAGGSERITGTYTFNTVGIYFVRACADKSSSANSGAISESSESNNCGVWTMVNVTDELFMPDLVAGMVTPAKAPAGVKETYYATITNQGNASTGEGFYGFIQVTRKNAFQGDPDKEITIGDDEDSKKIIDLDPVLMETLEMGNSVLMSVEYLFEQKGDYWMRACADKQNSAGGGLIPESNENNNCGAWTEMDIVDENELTGSLIVTSCQIAQDESTCNATVTWNVNNPVSGGTTAVTRDQPSSNFIVLETEDIKGSVSDEVSFAKEINYYLYHNGTELNHVKATATCEAGLIWYGNVCTSVEMAPMAWISVDPAVIVTGGSATLTWRSSGTVICKVSKRASGSAVDSGEIISTALSNEEGMTESPGYSTTYRIECSGEETIAAPQEATLTITTGDKKPIYKEN